MDIRGMMRRLLGGQGTAIWQAPGNLVPFYGVAASLQYTPVYRAVSLVSNDVARTELEVDDRAAASLLESPSQWMSAHEFRRTMQMQVLLYGNACAAINKTQGGELLELIVLEPDSVSLVVTNGRVQYRTTRFGVLEADQVFHLRAPSLSGLWGESPVGICKTAVSILATQERMALNAYANGGNPKLAIVHPRAIGEELMQRMEDYYAKKHAGAENAARPLVLADGVKVERISSTIDDSGLEGARRYSVADVSRIFGVPASYLSESVGSSYGSMEWLSRMYLDACLSHWFSAWSAEIRAKLCAPGTRVSWDTDELVRPGIAETMAALRTGVEAGVITRNEARAWLDYAPLAGLDEPAMALNMGTGGGKTNIGNDTSAQAGTANDH